MLHVVSRPLSDHSSTTTNRVRIAAWDQLILRKGLFWFADYYLRTDGLVNAFQRLSHHVCLQSTWPK